MPGLELRPMPSGGIGDTGTCENNTVTVPSLGRQEREKLSLKADEQRSSQFGSFHMHDVCIVGEHVFGIVVC
jgi:hypothetical protein